MNSRLYDKLCRILDEMAAKDRLSSSDLQVIDWATHAKKSMLAIDEMEGGSYEAYSDDLSGNTTPVSYNSRRNGRTSRRRNNSYGARRAYRDGNREAFTADLREMLEDAPDDQSRQTILRVIRELEERD